MKPVAVLTLTAMLLGLLAMGSFREANANGVPQLVKLTYLDGVSNWGPKNAEGVLEFSYAEAYAKVDVKNLVAQAGYTFDGWLTGPDGTALLVGPIAVDAAGIGRFEGRLTGLTSYDYNLFVISGRAEGSALPAKPSPQKSIAGRFTILRDDPNGAGADALPQLLPDTGQRPVADTGFGLGRGLYIAAVMAVSIGAVYTIRRFQRRRQG
jgi:hypothetical protein